MVSVVQRRQDYHAYEERSGRPSLVTDDLKEKVKAKIRGNRLSTIYELYEHFVWPARVKIQKTFCWTG